MIKHIKKARPRLFALTLVLLLVTAACSSIGSSDESATTYPGLEGGFAAETTTTAAATAEAPSDGDERSDLNAGQLGSGGIEPVVFQTSGFGRDIIFTADLTVAVPDVAAAGEQATRLIQGLGGFLFGQRTTGDPTPMSVLTFKVSPDAFQEALDRLGSIGDLRTQNVSADDVTERIVDVQSRINTAEASVERLRSLLEAAVDIKTIVELENELLQRETQLETMRGSLRTLEDQVALATIVLTITEAESRPAVSLNVTTYLGHDEGVSCPGSSGITVDQADEVTVCFEIFNVGDTFLTDFELRDPVLNVELDDLILVFGDPGTPIEPGESIVLATETVAERSLRTQTTVTATPVNEEGDVLSTRKVANTVTVFIQAVDPGGIPTFSEGLEASWEVLVNLGQVLVLFAGAILPFFWVPIAAWLIWRLTRRRPEGRASAQRPTTVPAGGPEREAGEES
ncbi:MAG: DUF4349 domain-containing protein [Acidimicrobiia bacterium]|nr:DUF4349 domain-containing protein [Acidimicrobiia bacterium]